MVAVGGGGGGAHEASPSIGGGGGGGGRAGFALLLAPRDYSHALRWKLLGFQGSPWLTCVKTFV